MLDTFSKVKSIDNILKWPITVRVFLVNAFHRPNVHYYFKIFNAEICMASHATMTALRTTQTHIQFQIWALNALSTDTHAHCHFSNQLQV